MIPEIDSIGAAIVKGVCNPEAKDLAVDLGDFGLRPLLGEKVLKEVPYLKLVIACRKTWTAIHDQLFLRKVAKFLASCPQFTDAQKEAFIREHLSDPKKAKNLGDAIVLILDKLDDLEKPEMLAKVFAAFVRGKITHESFRRLASAIDIGFIEDLKVLAYKHQVFWLPYLPNLVRTSLVNFQVHEGLQDFLRDPAGAAGTGLNLQTGEVAIGFHISPLGEIFVKCMNDSF
jgi:hypothetical protein